MKNDNKHLPLLRIHRFLPFTKVEGPGSRACIWVQGCPIKCKGCFNKETWPVEGGVLISVEEILKKIVSGPRIEGVSFLGGEPFAQASPLAELARKLRKMDFSIVTFTGYTIEKLQATGDTATLDLLHNTDLLIDGPFIEEQRSTSRPWVGSANQRYHFLTDRYKNIEKSLCEIPNRLEIRVFPDGRIFVNGLATTETLQSLLTKKQNS